MDATHFIEIALQSRRIFLPILLLVLLLGPKSAGASIAVISFASKVDFTVGAGPTSIESGDLDGDGEPDLVTANYGAVSSIGNSVSVLLNTTASGIIAFAPKLDFTTPDGPHGLALGDIDGDGKLDMVTANYGAFGNGDSMSIFRNTSTVGNLSFDPRADLFVDNSPLAVAIDDLDGDALADLAVTKFNEGTGSVVSILQNTSTIGSVSFAAKVDITVGPAGTGPYSIAIADLDGDGKRDLVVGNIGALAGSETAFAVLRNTSTVGNMTFAAPLNLTANVGPRKVAIRDLDGDAKPDIVVANFGAKDGTTISIFRNTSTSGNLSFETKLDQTVGTAPHGIAIGDLDTDGRADIVVTNFGNYDGTTLSVLRNNSTAGNLAFAGNLDFTTNTGPHDVTVVDLNGDGYPDLAVGNYGSNSGDGTTVSVLQNMYNPTSAVLLSFSASRTNKDFLKVTWRTGTELNVVGFNVWRKRGNSSWRKLNARLVPSKDLGGMGSNHYAYRDTQVRHGKLLRYQLQVMGPEGTLEWSDVVKVGAK